MLASIASKTLAQESGASVTPQYSIIFPVYNGERYLRESLESVLKQTYGDYELIIWDDASSDRSREIIAEYSNPRISFHRNEKNLGLFPTLNAAIATARGSSIRLWAQDDVMRPQCLEVEARCLAAYPDIQLAYSYYDVIDEAGMLRSKRPDVRACHVKSSTLATQIMIFHGAITGNISNMTIRRTLFDRIGNFREDMIYAADFEFLVRAARAHPLCCILQPLLFVRAHKGQFSQAPWAYRHWMHETELIYNTLLELLPETVNRRYARRYHWFHRRIPYLHHIVRLLLARDFKGARDLYIEFSRVPGNRLPLLAAAYLVTGNRRIVPRFLRPQYYKVAQSEIQFDSGWQDGLNGPHYSEVIVPR